MILITGATGNNGQELVRQLTAAARRARVKHVVKFSGMGADFSTAPELLRLHGETDLSPRSIRMSIKTVGT
jgi:uncharacterized protein YbjT (DUF2867 family)